MLLFRSKESVTMKNSGQDLSEDGPIETKVKEMTKTTIEASTSVLPISNGSEPVNTTADVSLPPSTEQGTISTDATTITTEESSKGLLSLLG